jgi:hypothetical protein
MAGAKEFVYSGERYLPKTRRKRKKIRLDATIRGRIFFIG